VQLRRLTRLPTAYTRLPSIDQAQWTSARRTQIDRDGRWTIKRGKKRQPAPGDGHKRQVEIAMLPGSVAVDLRISKPIDRLADPADR
jgi:hypothetical protein